MVRNQRYRESGINFLEFQPYKLKILCDAIGGREIVVDKWQPSNVVDCHSSLVMSSVQLVPINDRTLVQFWKTRTIFPAERVNRPTLSHLCRRGIVRVFQNFTNVRNTFIYRNWLYVLYLYRASTWYDDLAQYNWLSSLPSDGARGLRDGAQDGALDDNDGCHVQNSIQSQVMVNGILPDPLISKWMNCPKPNFYELCFTIYGFFTKFVANEKTNLSSSICSTLIHRHFQYLSIFT